MKVNANFTEELKRYGTDVVF